ncbi:hypothetical protein ACQFX9_07305 [Aliinostoc sp. HNIBRCY26]|uniref:hypothetical protein n=1 Tax=Aliinostoc sp. HNIBRCY26 TaxID=3418997 RepID=UPI003D03EA13
MSYVSVLKNIPEFLSQPAGIAAIASVGIHGAIALIVPLMPVDSKQPKEQSTQKTVGVLQLSQADLSRLPQTPDNNSVALQPPAPLLQNQFPQQPLLNNNSSNFNALATTVPPLPPPLNTPLSQPPIASVPNTSYPSYSSYPTNTLSQRQRLRTSSPREYSLHNPGISLSDSKFDVVASNQFTNQPTIPSNSQPLAVNKLPQLNPAETPSNLTGSSQANLPDNNIKNQANTQPIPPTDRIAPVVKNPGTAEDLNLANQSIPKEQQGSTPNVTDLPSKQTQQGEIALVNSYENLRKTLQQQYPNSQEKAVIRNTITTEKPGLDGIVLGVLVVDTQGKPLDIYFQDRSIAPELQQRAKAYFAENTPKGDKQISRYPFNLRFQYNSSNTTQPNSDKTPAVVIPNSGNNSNPNNPQPDANSSTLNQPTPAVTVAPSEQTTRSDNSSSTSKPSKELIRQLQNLRDSRQKKPNAN